MGELRIIYFEARISESVIRKIIGGRKLCKDNLEVKKIVKLIIITTHMYIWHKEREKLQTITYCSCKVIC